MLVGAGIGGRVHGSEHARPGFTETPATARRDVSVQATVEFGSKVRYALDKKIVLEIACVSVGFLAADVTEGHRRIV